MGVRSQATQFEGATYLNTEGGAPLISYVLSVASPAFASPYLVFDFGFASNETPAPSNFPDAFTLTLQNTSQAATAILASTDLTGTLWSPGGEGTIPIPGNAIWHQATAWPADAASLAFSETHQVAAPIPLPGVASGE